MDSAEAYTTYGVIGVKVWIYKGEVIEGEPPRLDAERRRAAPPPSRRYSRTRPRRRLAPSARQLSRLRPMMQQLPGENAETG